MILKSLGINAYRQLIFAHSRLQPLCLLPKQGISPRSVPYTGYITSLRI